MLYWPNRLFKFVNAYYNRPTPSTQINISGPEPPHEALSREYQNLDL